MKQSLQPQRGKSDLDSAVAALRAQFQGTFQSPWRFLVIAARSNVCHAAGQTYRLISRYSRFLESEQDEDVTYFIMINLYKRHLAGPLLGTILAACGAAEVFLRMALRAFFERDVSRQHRAKGPSKDILRQLEEFDSCTFLEKLDRVSKALLKRQCRDTLRSEFKFLVDFRNECFHSDPVLRRESGEDETTKRGSPKPVRPRRLQEYPFLWSSNYPLSLTHALRAVRVHDGIVQELLGSPIPHYLCDFFQLDDNLRLDRIEGFLAKPWSPKKFDTLAQGWSQVEEDLSDTRAKHIKAAL